MTETKQQSTNGCSRQELIEGWSKLYGRPITETEYLEIRDNLIKFFDTLYQWSKEAGTLSKD